MKGLVRQDILVLFSKNSFYTLVILLFLFIVLSFSGMGIFCAVLPVVIFSQFGVNAFHYESRSHWDKFTCSLPISRYKIVLARYVSALLLTVVGCVVSLAYTLILHVVHYSELKSVFIPVVLGLTFALLSMSISFPVLYKLGAERASNYISVLSFIGYAVLVLLFSFVPVSRMLRATVLAGILSMVCLVISFHISVRIYRMKDLC
jgi:hypothetical protein